MHVSRLKGDSTLWGVRLSSLSWPGALPARRIRRGQFKGLVERPGACNTHAQTYASFFSLSLLCRQLSMSGFRKKKHFTDLKIIEWKHINTVNMACEGRLQKLKSQCFNWPILKFNVLKKIKSVPCALSVLEQLMRVI